MTEKKSDDPSYSVTLLIEPPAAAEQFLHLVTNESEFASAFAQLGAVVLPQSFFEAEDEGVATLHFNGNSLNCADC